MLFLLYRTAYILQRECPFSLTVSSCLLKKVKMNSFNVLVTSVPIGVKMNIS